MSNNLLCSNLSEKYNLPCR